MNILLKAKSQMKIYFQQDINKIDSNFNGNGNENDDDSIKLSYILKDNSYYSNRNPEEKSNLNSNNTSNIDNLFKNISYNDIELIKNNDKEGFNEVQNLS